MTTDPVVLLTALGREVRGVLPSVRTPEGIDACRIVVQQVTLRGETMTVHSRTRLLDFARHHPMGLDGLALLADRLPPTQGTHWVGSLLSLGDAVADADG